MKAYVDASPTKACVVFDDEVVGVREGYLVREASRKYTNNEAEYRAVLLALFEAKRAGYILTEIFSDSQLVVKQLSGEYKVSKPELLLLWGRVIEAADGKVKFTWVPREENPAGKILG